ncbi:hypothetical protein [Qipengyuania sediminis]|uniref:hypothetical protein n=1 Tax=Qipengyuania sediminis TaxID=1532023 RepID=UPI00105A113B|nr:hypothetical protein [Qipengyuania sediminis]
MGTQIAQFLWVGPGLAPLEAMCLRSFVETGYTVHLYAYAALDAVPAGVTIKDAREILPESDIFRGAGARGGSFAPFADRFRYNLLHQKGGWWFDTDHLAIRLLPEPADLRISSQWEGREAGQYANVGAIWCRPGDERIGWLKDRSAAMLAAGGELQYTSLGPMLMNEMIAHFRAEANVAPWYEFCPYPHFMMDRLVYKSNAGFVKDKAKLAYHRLKQALVPGFHAAYVRSGTRAVHLWNEIWRVEGLDKHDRFHPGSFYGRNQRKYG